VASICCRMWEMSTSSWAADSWRFSSASDLCWSVDLSADSRPDRRVMMEEYVEKLSSPPPADASIDGALDRWTAVGREGAVEEAPLAGRRGEKSRRWQRRWAAELRRRPAAAEQGGRVE
jgi:hypothetical protein